MDIEQTGELVEYLRRSGRIGVAEQPDVRTLTGGVSNRTVLVHRPSGEAWVLKQALQKLRVSVEWLSPPERILREALGMRCLGELLPAGTVPTFVFEDPQHFILAMAAVPEPHRNWKTMLLAGELADDHIDQFARTLAAIHGGRSASLREAFAETSFFESLRLEPYYGYTAERAPAASAFLKSLMNETRSHRMALVHGDYSPKNILVHRDRLVLLDHEVIHFGDPAFDLGFSLTHLLSKANHLPSHRDQFAAAVVRYWTVYARAVSDPEGEGQLEARAVRQTLGCLLARVDGRSPLEYLSEEERCRQRSAVLDLMADPPARVTALVREFVRRISECR